MFVLDLCLYCCLEYFGVVVFDRLDLNRIDNVLDYKSLKTRGGNQIRISDFRRIQSE